MRLLLAEDDPRIAQTVGAMLAGAGYVVETVADGASAWFCGGTEDFDLIILDLGLPSLDGLTMLRRWRSAGRHTPVLILSARGTWAERVEGIDAGADDYLPKPFRLEELLSRVRALIRRAAGVGSPIIEAGLLRLDVRQMRLYLDGMAVALAPLEYRLMAYLMHHKGRVVPAPELLEHLYGDAGDRDLNALEAVVARLRRKLWSGAITTRRGFGYSIQSD